MGSRDHSVTCGICGYERGGLNDLTCACEHVDDLRAAMLLTLAANLAVAGALCAAFRAGDNFGFHMGSDESQCTCQWRPNVHGEPYRGSTRCEQDVLDEQDDHYDDDCPHCDYGCSSCSPLIGGEG